MRVDVPLDQPGEAQVDAADLDERVGQLRERAGPDVVVLLGQPAYGVPHAGPRSCGLPRRQAGGARLTPVTS